MTKRNPEAEYRGQHTAPDRESGAPLHNITRIYPDDAYGQMAWRYYGDGRPDDAAVWGLVRGLKGRPRASVRVYRAVPAVVTRAERIADIEKQMAYVLRHGKPPAYADTSLGGSRYYALLDRQLEALRSMPEAQESRVRISPGDWVTIWRPYAVEHGRGLGRYRILSKLTTAAEVFTAGDSIYEWGYDPADS